MAEVEEAAAAALDDSGGVVYANTWFVVAQLIALRCWLRVRGVALTL